MVTIYVSGSIVLNSFINKHVHFIEKYKLGKTGFLQGNDLDIEEWVFKTDLKNIK